MTTRLSNLPILFVMVFILAVPAWGFPVSGCAMGCCDVPMTHRPVDECPDAVYFGKSGDCCCGSFEACAAPGVLSTLAVGSVLRVMPDKQVRHMAVRLEGTPSLAAGGSFTSGPPIIFSGGDTPPTYLLHRVLLI